MIYFPGIRYKVHLIAFYDQNNYKTKKQPHNNLQTTIHGERALV